MKFGAIPTSLAERLALMSGKVPVPVLDALIGPLKARCIMTAASLGLFEALRETSLTAADLAGRCRVDAGSLELLLRALVVFDYARQQRGSRGAGSAGSAGSPGSTDGADRFALTPLARRTMLADAPQALTGYLAFNAVQWRFLEQLDALLLTGRGLDFHATMTDPAEWQAYQQAMLEFARFDAPILAARVPVAPGSVSLLDLGGSHGLLGAAICRRHPPLRSTVIDLPSALPHARALARAEHLEDVVSHEAGDLLTADLGHERDVVLLSQVLHHFSAATNAAIVQRVHAAVRPGGTIAIWDLEAPRMGSRASAGDIPALFFRLTSSAGGFHGDDCASWLRDAGFDNIRIARPVLSPGNVLITGRRK